MITMNPSQMTTMSNCLVTSSLLKNSFGSSNTQLLQTIDSYLSGSTTTANSTASSNTSSSSTSSSTGTDSSSATSGISTSSLLTSLIDTFA